MPRWDKTLHLGDVFHNETLTFAERRDAIVGRIRAAGWYRAEDDFYLDDLIDRLTESADEDEFDDIWDEFYDWADDYRLWIETIS